MARLVVLALEDGGFSFNHFLVAGLFPHWRDAGHEVMVHEGIDNLPDADLALLHVDLTVVPPDYLQALRRYPAVINGATADIGKRTFSRHLVTEGDGYTGPVIVKTNLNCGGIPEAFRRKVALEKGLAAGPPVRFMRGRYPVFPSATQVPAGAFRDPELVVEKFVPEQDQRGFYMRTWVFFGDSGRCNRLLGLQPVVKAGDVIERVPCEVPEAIRAERERMQFDYGKFDFVIHQGEPILLDVNRTPTVPANLSEAILAGMGPLAAGLDLFVQRASRTSVGQRSPNS